MYLLGHALSQFSYKRAGIGVYPATFMAKQDKAGFLFLGILY